MPTATPSRAERAALCDLLDRVGPDAPTLCEGWTTKDLAVHLVLRERAPLGAVGILAGGPARALHERATRRLAARPYGDLVATIRRGPPLLLVPLDSFVNLVEYFVHHEDVRRGGGDATPRPATETVALDDALWEALGRSAWLLTRPLGPVGLELRRPDGATRPGRRGTPTATLAGPPGELVLFLTGRREASHATLDGPPAAVEAVRAARLGF